MTHAFACQHKHSSFYVHPMDAGTTSNDPSETKNPSPEPAAWRGFDQYIDRILPERLWIITWSINLP
jgi:hypothetical protein